MGFGKESVLSVLSLSIVFSSISAVFCKLSRKTSSRSNGSSTVDIPGDMSLNTEADCGCSDL